MKQLFSITLIVGKKFKIKTIYCNQNKYLLYINARQFAVSILFGIANAGCGCESNKLPTNCVKRKCENDDDPVCGISLDGMPTTFSNPCELEYTQCLKPDSCKKLIFS